MDLDRVTDFLGSAAGFDFSLFTGFKSTFGTSGFGSTFFLTGAGDESFGLR